MERNIDRNLRMAKREANRLGRRGARSGVLVVALLLSFGAVRLLEPYVPPQLFNEWLGWIGVAAFGLFSAAIFLLLKVFGIGLWGRRRNGYRS